MSAKDAQQVSLQSLYHPNDTLEVFTAKLKSVTNGSIDPVDNGISKKDMLAKAKKIFYSIPLVQIHKKPDAKSKLFNSYDVTVPNYRHEIDILYLPHDDGYKYLLVVVDVASRYICAKPLKEKSSSAVTEALKLIYTIPIASNRLPNRSQDPATALVRLSNRFGPPIFLHSDQGSEFKGVFQKYLKDLGIRYIDHEVGSHLPFVENANKEISKRIFRNQNDVEMETKKNNSDWIDIIDKVIYDLNHKYRKSINDYPYMAILKEEVPQSTMKFDESLCKMVHPIGTKVRRLLRSDEVLDIPTGKIKIERRRETDPKWSLEVYTVVDVRTFPDKLALHYITSSGKPFKHKLTYWRLQPIS